MTVKRLAKGELRIFVNGAALEGVVSSQLECVGYGRGNLTIKLSCQYVRFDDENERGR